LIDQAVQKGIPIVSLSNSIEDPGLSYVGISTYDLGYKSGLAVKKAASPMGQVQIAVLINSNFSMKSYQEYLKGLQKALSSSSNIQVKLILNSKGETISAEEQTQRILKDHPEIQIIVCTDLNDTIGVTKVVIDLNRVSQISIIGSGLSEEIANYIKRGVIWGVLTEDPNELGAQAMTALIRLKKGVTKNEVYHLPLFLVDPKNVNQMYSNHNHSFRGLSR
jgi:ribose transport system substrate-binding protein